MNRTSLDASLTNEEHMQLASKTEGYTHAEIEGIVLKAWELAIRNNKQEITFDILIRAIDLVVMSTSDRIEEMTKIALNECNDLEFIPEAYKSRK